MSIFLFLLLVLYGLAFGFVEYSSSMASSAEPRFISRKLVEEPPGDLGVVTQPNRVGETQCTKDDILLHQEATVPMPDGIPTYTVTVMNTCPEKSGCAMTGIHLTCGWFSSARQLNPGVLVRLRFDDCLLNGGAPLPSGFAVSFQYANTYPYRFSVSVAECRQR
ncbi:hypothetical protein HPP92_011545 [Vanilla planifolia]|uniref:Uncharacterized protein n=1 Tax=Vanilla planifolia TaxID=51239 RepID=A0A835R797_VANPL|nr:hypothetical protein HPP92_011545 [Vanilla planifolia]